MLIAQNIELTEEKYWARVFFEAGILECGITFVQFMTDPCAYLVDCGQESAPYCIRAGFRPLLPKQAAVAKRLREQGF